MNAPPLFRTSAEPYRRTPVFDENTLPAGLRREHRTKPGVWGIIRVFEGRLRYCGLDPDSATIVSETILEPGHRREADRTSAPCCWATTPKMDACTTLVAQAPA